ncbi:DNA-binding domain-containing protein [Clostridiaceae bacterium HSG29]|nr:DNA-binding domain-containing protein [Clostridiaceae bacterium HSG29]
MEFYIIDDDASIIRILENLIEKNDLGIVLGKSKSAKKAIKEVIEVRPDIVLIDLLIPKIDGINIVKEIREIDESISFIMISEVNDKEMVSKAYSAGIEYYINKPINIIESIEIINRVKQKRDNIDLISSYERIRRNNNINNIKKINNKNKLDLIISTLNKVGATGKGKIDLANIINEIIESNSKMELYNQNMVYFYEKLSNYYIETTNSKVKEKTIKQRIRRSIIDSLETVASLGLEDYLNPTFEKYASTIFNFSEVRKEMDYQKGASIRRGKVDIKRFIGGILNEVIKF